MRNNINFKEKVELFTLTLENGFWDESTYIEIKGYILEDSKNIDNEVPLAVAYAYYLLGATISHLLGCYQNPSDIYEVENLSKDEFHGKYTDNIILMNIRFGKYKYEDYEKYF